MRLLVLCFALLSSGLMVAQNNSIEVYPWNPDANNDNAIGTSDLLEFLPVFGTYFGTPPEPCDYEGTPLEELFAGLLTGAIVLDSVFVEFELEDSAEFYLIGCPEPVTDTVIFAYSSMIHGIGSLNNSNRYTFTGPDNEGFTTFTSFEVDVQTNTYRFSSQIDKLESTGFIEDGFFGGFSHSSQWVNTQLPFPNSWYFDAMGIHVTGWEDHQWPFYANYLHILPYWHYAE
jgi:hypothetical protein